MPVHASISGMDALEVGESDNATSPLAEGLGNKDLPLERALDCTTVMLRNIPCKLSQEDVMRILIFKGMTGQFDTIFAPSSSTRQSNLGYAFVNFIRPEYVEECIRLCDGKPFGVGHSGKLCKVALADLQGRAFKRSNAKKGKLRVVQRFSV